MAERQRVLRIGLLAPLEELDPRCVGEILTETACRQIFETPFQMKNHQGHAKPWLFATPFSQRSGDGEPAVQAIVRSDVVFSDGLPMTAGDVATCLREDPQLGCHTIRADGERLVIEGVSDPREIEVALCQTRTAVWRSTPVGLVGTGPFRLCRPRGLHEQAGQETVELEPNPCYPRTPELDRICFEVFPPDGDGVPTALEAALRDGSVDLAFGLGKARAEGLSGFVRQCTPGLSIALLFFNTARPPFDQQRLRLAVAKVLDRSQLARQLYERPFAFVATSLLPPELGRYWDKLSYDPGEARALATDCVLPGRPLELLVVKDPRPYLPHPERAARWIIEQLAALGLPAVIKDSVTSAEFKSRAASGEYDLALAGWALESLDSHHYLESILSSQRVPTQSATDGNRFNVGRLESAEMDAALERYRAEGHDQALADVLCLGATLMPVLPLLYGANIVVHSERLQGVSMGPRGVPALSQVRFAPPASLPLPGHHAAG